MSSKDLSTYNFAIGRNPIVSKNEVALIIKFVSILYIFFLKCSFNIAQVISIT